MPGHDQHRRGVLAVQHHRAGALAAVGGDRAGAGAGQVDADRVVVAVGALDPAADQQVLLVQLDVVHMSADITGDGRADIVGFGDTGVWTALSNGDGTFPPPRVVLADFC